MKTLKTANGSIIRVKDELALEMVDNLDYFYCSKAEWRKAQTITHYYDKEQFKSGVHERRNELDGEPAFQEFKSKCPHLKPDPEHCESPDLPGYLDESLPSYLVNPDCHAISCPTPWYVGKEVSWN